MPRELRAHHRALPSAFSDLPESNHDWRGGSARPALRLSASEITWVDFFPGDERAPALIAVQPHGDVLEMRFDRLGGTGSLRGLAVGQVAGEPAFFNVDVPLPR